MYAHSDLCLFSVRAIDCRSMKKQNTNSDNLKHSKDIHYEPIDPEQERLDQFLQDCMEAYWQKRDENIIPWPYGEEDY